MNGKLNSEVRSLRAVIVENSEELKKARNQVGRLAEMEEKVSSQESTISQLQEAVRILDSEKKEVVELLQASRAQIKEEGKKIAEAVRREEKLESKLSQYTKGMQDLIDKYKSKKASQEKEKDGKYS